MKLSRFEKLAFVLLPAMALLSCSKTSVNPPVGPMHGTLAIGQCANYNWKDNCPPNSPNLCPQPAVGGDCKMTISDDGATVTAQQGKVVSDYICVTKNTKVDWMEGNDKSFVVAFGTPSPFANKAVFSGNSGAPDSGSIVADPNPAPECNKYLIANCNAAGCIAKDPVVIVQPGH
jgi:hypothetical protein